MTEQDFHKKLHQVNQRLKVAKIGVSIFERGNRLYLRGTFPPKPGATKTKAHQQHIALKIYANPQGLKQAENEAKKIGAALALKEFDWSPYIPIANSPMEKQSVAEWFAAYEEDYFQRRQLNPTTKGTWRTGYSTYYRRLPQDEPLTLEVLDKVIRTKTTPDSFPRLAMCRAFKLLAQFSGLEVKSIERLKGSYSPRRRVPRDLPSDEEIVEYFSQISDPRCQWAYGMLATYGLRPHELFHLDTEELEKGGERLSVLSSTKTGARRVYPLHPEWIELFNLRDVRRLNVETKNKSNSELGAQVSIHFNKAKIPFPPYNLRHCWAVRALQLKIDIAWAARWMGHSVDVHTRDYHRWISAEAEQQMYEAVIQNRSTTLSNIPSQPPEPAVQPASALSTESTACNHSPSTTVTSWQVSAIHQHPDTQSPQVTSVTTPKKTTKRCTARLETSSEFQQLSFLDIA